MSNVYLSPQSFKLNRAKITKQIQDDTGASGLATTWLACEASVGMTPHVKQVE